MEVSVNTKWFYLYKLCQIEEIMRKGCIYGSSSGSILFAIYKAMPAMKINMVCTLTLCMLVIFFMLLHCLMALFFKFTF